MRIQLRRKQPPHQKYESMSWPRLIIVIVLSWLIALGIVFWVLSTGYIVPIYWYPIFPIILTAISLTLLGLQRLLSTSFQGATSPSIITTSPYPSTQPNSTEATSPPTSAQTEAAETTSQEAEVRMLPPGEGAVFLLRKLGILPPNSLLDDASAADHASAGEVSQLLNSIPFALNLAGAYMRETRCSFSDYVEHYQNQRTKLLKAHRNLPTNQLESVTVTCTLTLQKVEQSNPTAADLLRLMAYLAPDAIPEEIITVGVSNLDAALETIAVDKQQLDSACRLLHKYSLIYWDTEARTLSVDYLVQWVLKNEMKRKQQRQWAEYAIRAVNLAFPPAGSATRNRCEQFLPQGLVCITHINTRKMTFPEAIQLLNQVGYYLEERGLYTQAEPLYQQSLTIREKTLGPTHPFTAASLNNFATFYERQGKFEQAEPLYQRALTIYEKVLGPTHSTTALVAEHYADLQKKREQQS